MKVKNRSRRILSFFLAPAVTKSNEGGLSSFRIVFDSNVVFSRFDYTWAPD